MSTPPSLPAEQLRAAILGARSLVILTHKNPDGDALGAALGLCNFFLQKDKKTCVLIPDAYPHYYRFLPGRHKIVVADKQPDAARLALTQSDLIFCLDFNRLDRLDLLEETFRKLQVPKVLIDHHPDPEKAEWIHVFHDTSASSTSEMVGRFLELVFPQDPLSPEVATCLFTGIFMDTGGFMYGFSADTFRQCMRLMEAGARTQEFIHHVFQNNTLDRLRLFGYCLYEKLQVLPEYATAYMSLTQEEMKRFNFRKGDSENFVNMALSLGNVQIAVLITEQDNGITRLSFRSKGEIPVNELATLYFSGGGHRNAAGGQVQGNASQAEALLKEKLPEWLRHIWPAVSI
ncbi:MAG: bifunctional oligoribonuclease/PAP phosphatase NrnA [Flavobacteriales bacterium]|nr:bifunctional oligoribonuclease/PAP phosphatase NrnA [Flavobacteriales bacterium]MCX7768463.1 bifunctional oligoribonuclease/PAP phosphatase NrnA [Flavobacteriales bacterium]MDW8410637.1 bifunctional oligoribonuclease/PAP phosphatase NrnA [Flavobacteriales bacterium]